MELVLAWALGCVVAVYVTATWLYVTKIAALRDERDIWRKRYIGMEAMYADHMARRNASADELLAGWHDAVQSFCDLAVRYDRLDKECQVLSARLNGSNDDQVSWKVDELERKMATWEGD